MSETIQEKFLKIAQECDRSIKNYSKVQEIYNLIENNESFRGKMKKLLKSYKNIENGFINDNFILSLSNFYLERNKKGDLETAKECLSKIINKNDLEYKIQEIKCLKLENKTEEAINKYKSFIVNFYKTKNLYKISESFAEVREIVGNDIEIVGDFKSLCNVINPKVSRITSKDIKLAVESYFKYAEEEVKNILESNSQNKEEELDNLFKNIGQNIDRIKGDFSEVNGKDRSKLFEKDEFFTFYQNIENKLSLDFSEYLENIKNNPIVINMLKIFSEKGSYVGFFKFDGWYRLGDESYKNSKKEDMKKIAELEYKNNSKDHLVNQRFGEFIFNEENIDINKIETFFNNYKDNLELLKTNSVENFKAGASELIRFFEDTLLSNKNMNIEKIQNFEEEIKNLCDLYPYGFNYGNSDITDYYNIILNRKEFFNIFENFKEENTSELTDDLKSKSFINFCQDLRQSDKITSKLEDFFTKIIDNKDRFEYYIFYIRKSELEKLEELCPRFKGKTAELLSKKIFEKFDQNIDFINTCLSGGEIDKDTEKKINRTLSSLTMIVDKISEKKLNFPQEKKGKLKALFNNLKNNSNIPENSEIINYKNKLEEIDFKNNLKFINDIFSENTEITTEEENSKKINNLMEFIKDAKNEKIENLKIYKEELRKLFNNLESTKNQTLFNMINEEQKNDLNNLKSVINDGNFSLSRSNSLAQ